jgi:hypothetical protein
MAAREKRGRVHVESESRKAPYYGRAHMIDGPRNSRFLDAMNLCFNSLRVVDDGAVSKQFMLILLVVAVGTVARNNGV